jgi:DNA modification methylase
LRDYGTVGQFGLKHTPEEYIAKMVEGFREVKRVLRKDGTVWLNLGDSYFGGGRGGVPQESSYRKQATNAGSLVAPTKVPVGCKPKDLCMIPARVALALQADGWYLRQDIIWAKPNPMPESVTDRCTKAHEYIFLLSKSASYYYDAEAIKEASVTGDERRPYGSEGSWMLDGRPPEQRHGGKPRNGVNSLRGQGAERDGINGAANRDGRDMQAVGVGMSRNKRSVWTIATSPFPEAHFATFPPKLVEPCILAGTSEKGCCAECGAPWKRIMEKTTRFESGSGKSGNPPEGKNGSDYEQAVSGDYDIRMGPVTETRTVGWRPTCTHNAETVPCTVLDPFSGAGTTGLVACKLQRSYIGIELNPEYVAMSERRIRKDAPLFL